MQGKKLLPGQQNIAGGGVLPRAPHRGRRDAPLEAGHRLAKAAAGDLGDKSQAFGVMVMADVPGMLAWLPPGFRLDISTNSSAGPWPV